MIPNQWYAILEDAKLKAKPIAIKRFGLDLVLWRKKHEQKIIAMLDKCPHRGVKLSLGSVEKDEIQCKYHGFCFNEKGQCTNIPCDNKQKSISKALLTQTFIVQEKYGLLWLWWGAEDQAQKTPIPWLDGVDEKATLTQMSIVWPQHYVRSIETNFDASHFFYVHKQFLPGIGPYVSHINIENQSKLGFSCEMRVAKPFDKQAKQWEFIANFAWPNLCTIGFNDFYGGLIIDTPIDHENTWRYMRLTKFPIKNKLLRNILGKSALWLDWFFTQKLQDMPIIKTMQPRLPIENAHHFVRADLGMATYRQLRKKIIANHLDHLALFPLWVQKELLFSQNELGLKAKEATKKIIVEAEKISWIN